MIQVKMHTANLARLYVPFDPEVEGFYNLTLVAEYFVQNGVPYALAEILATRPDRGELLSTDCNVIWYKDGAFLVIEVILFSEVQDSFELGGE